MDDTINNLNPSMRVMMIMLMMMFYLLVVVEMRGEKDVCF